MADYDGSERRRRRSEVLDRAIAHQLEHVREVYGLTQVVLASDDGLPVAASRRDDVAGWLSALAPEMAAEAEAGAQSIATEYLPFQNGKVSTLEIELGGGPMYLVGLARLRAPLATALARARLGVERIFATVEPF